MPRPPARALTPGAAVLEHHVAELRAGAGCAAERLAAEDEPSADAGAEREHDHVARPSPGADLPLGDRGGVAVVVDGDGQPEPLFHQPAYADVGQWDVHGGHGPASALVD